MEELDSIEAVDVSFEIDQHGASVYLVTFTHDLGDIPMIEVVDPYCGTASGTDDPSLCSSHCDALRVAAMTLTGEFTSMLEPSIAAEPPVKFTAESVSIPPEMRSRDEVVLLISCVLARAHSVTVNVPENVTVPDGISTRSSVASPADCTAAVPPFAPSNRSSASTSDAPDVTSQSTSTSSSAARSTAP